MKTVFLSICCGFIFFLGCSQSEKEKINEQDTFVEEVTPKIESIGDQDTPVEESSNSLKILSLGDSYTIGESVCNICRFPEQLKDSIEEKTVNKNTKLKVIAVTGWTTSNLKAGIAAENLEEDYNLATLLIGVNNQFQGRPFQVFEKEFPELTKEAIKYAQGKKENLIVVSIPDYAYTPYGNGNSVISQGIDKYNVFIENYCNQNSITYINITDITREGIQKPALVANDGLHPSTIAYTAFVNRILPEALKKIDNNTTDD